MIVRMCFSPSLSVSLHIDTVCTYLSLRPKIHRLLAGFRVYAGRNTQALEMCTPAGRYKGHQPKCSNQPDEHPSTPTLPPHNTIATTPARTLHSGRQRRPPHPTLPHLPHPGRDSGRGGWPEAVVSWHDMSKSTGRKLRALCDVPGFRLMVKQKPMVPCMSSEILC